MSRVEESESDNGKYPDFEKRKFNKSIALLFSIVCTLIVGCISFMSGNEKENKDRKENTFSFYWKFKWRQQLLLLYIGTFQLGKLLTSSFREGLKKSETWVFFGAYEWLNAFASSIWQPAPYL